MARQMPTLMVPESANLPVNDIPAPEWIATKGQASRAATQRYDIREFGDPFVGDAGTVFNAARAAVQSVGGGVIIAPAGLYSFTSGIELAKGVHIDFAGVGNTHLDFTGLTDPVGGVRPSAIYGEGARTRLPNLTTQANANSRTLTLASAPTPALRPGDVIQIYNPASYSFSPYRDYYRNGEFARVKAQDGATITLTKPLISMHPTTVEVYRVDPIRTGIRGASMTFPDGVRGILTRFGSQLSFRDLELRDSNQSQIEFSDCFDFAVRDIDARSYKPMTNVAYAMAINGCQDWVVSDCFLEADHHGLTTGGASIPNRRGRIKDSTISNLNATGAPGVGFHGNTEFVTIENCELPTGAGPAGDFITLRNNRIGSAASGRCVNISEALGASFTLDGNEIRPTQAHLENEGYVRIHWSLSDHASGHGWTINRTNGILTIRNNTIYMGGFAPPSGDVVAILIRNNESLPWNNHLIIEGNVGIHAVTSRNVYTVKASRSGNGLGMRRVVVSDNHGNGSLNFNGFGARYVTLVDNDISETTSVGIQYIDNGVVLGAGFPTTITATGNSTHRNQDAGLVINGLNSGGSPVTIIVEGNASLGNNQRGSGGASRSSIVLSNAEYVVYTSNTIGDNQPTVTQTDLDSISTVTTLIDGDNDMVGPSSLRNKARSSVGAVRFRGAGQFAPENVIAASVGSLYLCHGNGLVYRKASGTGNTGWKALSDVV